MFLAEDGKFYVDEHHNVELTSELIYHLYTKLSAHFFSNKPIPFSDEIQGKDYNFLYKNNELFYVDKNNKEFQIKIQSTKIIFRAEKKDNERDVFTYEQFKKNLEIFNISFPWSDDTVVTEYNINEKIKNNDKSSRIIIENIDFKSLRKLPTSEMKKFKDLSSYIRHYLKSEVNIEKYEENNFLDKDIFNVDPESKIEFFIPVERKLFLDDILGEFKKGIKEYFFTGLHSIGKTFTLLIFNFMELPSTKKAYYNLETLKKNQKFFEIIIYESQGLFDNEEKWEEAFISLKNEINDSKNFLLILFNFIKLLAQSYNNLGKKYIIILDQIKFEKIEDNEYNYINLIREVVQQTKNFYLIGCCSINYKGVKEILFYNWSRREKEPNEKNIPKLKYIKCFGFKDDIIINNNLNKYLHILGNLPRFKNIKDKLNSKIVNLFIKKTKEKFLKFYGLKKFYEFRKIEDIRVLKKFENREDFLDELDKIPFKYFLIYEEQNMFDFSCPLIKRAINELLEENELRKKETDYNCELGWYFEKRVIFKLRVSNLIPNKYYIDNSYLVSTIFLPYKVENLDHKENSLFYFEYCNVKRYDCAIYLGIEKAFILTQISINKPKNKLDEYNPINFQTDLEDLQKFIKINKLKVQKFYLLFILFYSNYKTEKNLKTIREKNFSYILFDLQENKFIGQIEKGENLYEIPNTINSEKAIDINANFFEFGKIDGSFDYKYHGKYHKYYAEKYMSLERFFNEIFDEYIKDEFKKKTEIDFLNFNLFSFNCDYNQAFYNEMNKRILLLNYKEGEIYYGIGDSKDNFVWHSYNIVYRTITNLKNNIEYKSMTCFLFIKDKILYPKDNVRKNRKKK